MCSVQKSLCHNAVPEVTVSSRGSVLADREKRMIIILARQHPGETWSSFLAEAILRNLQ